MTALDGSSIKKDQVPRLLFSCRLHVVLMGCLSLIVVLLLRVNLSLTLVCMVRRQSSSYGANSTNNPTADEEYDTMTSNATHYMSESINDTSIFEGEFDWSRQFQGFLLSSYYYGYLSTQMLGGLLSGRYGAKHVIGSAIFISVGGTLVTPVAARWNKWMMVSMRILVGAGSGLVISSVQSLLGQWAPKPERSFLTIMAFQGTSIGHVVGLFVSSHLCEVKFDNGWPIIFYVTGAFGFLSFILWNFIVYSTPGQHPRITDDERDYIELSTGITSSIITKQKHRFPWLKAIRSPAVLAIIAAHTANAWYGHTSATTFPTYMNEVLHFNIKQNALFLILPGILVLVFNFPQGLLADYFIRRGIFMTVVVRKIFQSVAGFGCSALVICLSFLDHERRYVAVSILVLNSVLLNFTRSGYLVSPQDIAPRFSGEIFGMSSMIATVSGILAPLAVGQLTTNGTQQEWQVVFAITAAFFIVGALLFLIFAKGEVQYWAIINNDRTLTVPESKETTELIQKITSL